jgi:EAL domain-containing protein (putative c-di-GMP-specific phosphodiesterase class I)
VSDGTIDVFFQPKADAAGRRVTGVEALARWIHPERGVISPTVFIPISEQAGLSRALTRHVLDRSLAQRAVWGHLDVSVNVTVADLIDVGFPNEVAAALERHGVPAEALVLEITESSILSDPARITVTLDRLDAIGVRVSLDDFGTGYSSLAHLRALPVQEVKIDRSFVTSMLSDPADAAIVRAIVALAHELGMLVVAEGVEDEGTWDALAALGCDTIQGYALSRPLPAQALDAVLSAQQIR